MRQATRVPDAAPAAASACRSCRSHGSERMRAAFLCASRGSGSCGGWIRAAPPTTSRRPCGCAASSIAMPCSRPSIRWSRATSASHGVSARGEGSAEQIVLDPRPSRSGTSTLDGADRETQALACWRDRKLAEPFDLEAGPLMRVALLALEEGRPFSRGQPAPYRGRRLVDGRAGRRVLALYAAGRVRRERRRCPSLMSNMPITPNGSGSG